MFNVTAAAAFEWSLSDSAATAAALGVGGVEVRSTIAGLPTAACRAGFFEPCRPMASEYSMVTSMHRTHVQS